MYSVHVDWRGKNEEGLGIVLFHLYLSNILLLFLFQLTPDRLKIPPVTRTSITRSHLMRDMERKPDKDSGLHPSRGNEFLSIYIYGQKLSNHTISPPHIRLWVYQLQVPCACLGCTTIPQQQSDVLSSCKRRAREKKKTKRERYCYFSKITTHC